MEECVFVVCAGVRHDQLSPFFVSICCAVLLKHLSRHVTCMCEIVRMFDVSPDCMEPDPVYPDQSVEALRLSLLYIV